MKYHHKNVFEMKEPIRLLIIEDNDDDAILEAEALKKGGFDVIFERVDNPMDLREALRKQSWDCVISDYSLPSFSGLDALAIFLESALDIPFIIISGAIGEETAVIAMKAGAHDYIMKSNLNRLVPALQRELREANIRQQKKRAETAIKYEKILLRTLIDNVPDLIYIKDTECRRIVSNDADVGFTGFQSEQEITGKTDLEIFRDEFGKRNHAADMMVLQSGCPQSNSEENIFDSKGNSYWFQCDKIPIRDGEGNITGLVGIFHDISHRKEIEFDLLRSEQSLKKQNLEYEALNKEYLSLNEELTESLERIKRMNDDLIIAKNKAEEGDKLKSSFLANMSHEIRTPLNAILGFSSFLKNPEMSKDRTAEFVDIIEASGKQLLSIINDILEISQIEAGQVRLTVEPVNISKLLNELFLQFKKDASLKGIELILNINNSAQDIITNTDGSKVRQILTNLISNAIKFTSEGKVEFAARVSKNHVLFYVKDTGIGIDPEYQTIIFEPFRQVETTISRNFGGNGLGLSICRALVEKLGGKMTVNSLPNKGSTFSFTIPFVSDKELEMESLPDQIPEKYDWKKHLILVAEDETYNFKFIEEMLSPTHAKILHARDGIEAVELVRQIPDISLVIMDLKMPEMDGYKATKIIKQLRPDLPVIAQTATLISEHKDWIANAGFDKYLSKPLEIRYFMEVIDNFLD